LSISVRRSRRRSVKFVRLCTAEALVINRINIIVGTLCWLAQPLVVFECKAAGDFVARVTDTQGVSTANAVVSLHALNFTPPPAADAPRAFMDQRNRRFDPHVLPVWTGTLVNFPNSDEIHHSVYSFSAPKRFKLPLYKDMPAEPLMFDQSGVVTLGCNIHDWMLGYIYVTDTPYFGITDAQGTTRVDALPAGRYEVRLWHSHGETRTSQVSETVQVNDAAEVERNYRLELRAASQDMQPAPSTNSVEDKFGRWSN